MKLMGYLVYNSSKISGDFIVGQSILGSSFIQPNFQEQVQNIAILLHHSFFNGFPETPELNLEFLGSLTSDSKILKGGIFGNLGQSL